MRTSMVSEFRKLRTTRTAGGLLAALLLVVGLGTWAVAGRLQGADLARPLELQPFLLVAVSALPVFALILGIRSFTDEFRHGSIVPTILATPDRRRVFAAKALVGAGAGALVALLALAVSLGVGAAVLASTGAAPTWSATGLLLHAGRFAAAGALWAAIGVGIGALVRHQVAAIVGSLVWLLVGENMLLGAFPGAGRFLPGTAGAAALGLQTGRVSITMLAALGVLAAWAAGSAVVGATALRARDVT